MEKLYTKAIAEKTDKGLVAVASTAVEDRHGEVVEVSGWDLKNFKKNPVLLWGHQHDIPAIGLAKNIKVEGEGKRQKLMFEPVFHEATEFARAIKAMYEDLGVLNSFSVGFLPLEVEDNRYTKHELLEISAVNVPANPEARVMAMKSLAEQGFKKDTLEALGLPESKDQAEILSQLAVASERINELEDQVTDLVKGLKHLNPRVDRQEAIVTRLTMVKTITRATDRLLEAKPRAQSELAALRVIKRASDKLTYDTKRDLKTSGKNQRTS